MWRSRQVSGSGLFPSLRRQAPRDINSDFSFSFSSFPSDHLSLSRSFCDSRFNHCPSFALTVDWYAIVQCLAFSKYSIVTRHYTSADYWLSHLLILLKSTTGRVCFDQLTKKTMKQSILLLGLSASATLANIYFPKVQPTCNSQDLQFSGCLKGQFCQENNTYAEVTALEYVKLTTIDALL